MGQQGEDAVKGDSREGKYLMFALGGEEYGIGICKVKEIIGMIPITPLPQTPEHIKGVINLRGKVIPIIDLRLRFGMESAGCTDRTCIVVVEFSAGNGAVMIGNVVDSVSEVVSIKAGEIENAPSFGVKLNTEHIVGMAKSGGSVKMLLDIDRVLGWDESSFLNTVA